jgi:OPA family glycerol-3-phosphate transporter-like MFS transporter
MVPNYFYPVTVALCLSAIIAAYFFNNPLGHNRWFLIRRFINWFPLGMTYVFLYMGRYNLNVSKNALGTLMSGTAATDFAGRKATATCSGIVDGCAYLGSGIQSVSLGYLTTWNWHSWPVFLMPFSLIGGGIALWIWNALPAATRKYIADIGQRRA